MRDPEQNTNMPPLRFQLKLAYKLILFVLCDFAVLDTQLNPAVLKYVCIKTIYILVEKFSSFMFTLES